MAPHFFNFKEMRRRSKASFRTYQSADTESEGATPTTSGSVTPPSLLRLAHRSVSALSLHLKDQSTIRDGSAAASPVQRPPLKACANGAGNRHSVSGMAGLGSPALNGRGPGLPTSQFSPRIANVTDNSWVYQKVLLVHGTIGDPAQPSVEGTLTVSRLDDAFPPTCWPVCDSQFRALVYMSPGANKLRFDFASPKLANSGSSNPIHASYLTVHMLLPLNAPPLQLAILLAKDSPGTFDAVPARVEREGNGLDAAVRKYRMAAYLWQAFTAEQMRRNKLGRRVFRFDEEWSAGTSNQRDHEFNTMRSEARIHIVRLDKTVAELRDLDIAQQNPTASDKGALYGIAADAVRKYFDMAPGQKQYVAALLLDAHWDKDANMITGHAALGGGSGDLQLAIFGSHCLQSYPSCFEEVVPAFNDCTPTDTNYVANDCNESGSSWEAANIGIGAHMHEVGHLLGCPHQENGIMARDYVTLNRTFLSREAYSTRTKSKGGPVTISDECAWHRLDCLRFRSHPCFRLPNDPPTSPDDSVQAWPVEGGNVMFTAATGLSFIEIFGAGDDVCRNWIEYPVDQQGVVQRNVLLSDQDLRNRLPEDSRKGPLRVSVKSIGGGSLDIDDFRKLCSKEATLRLPSAVPGLGRLAFRGKKLGASQTEGSEPQDVMFTSTLRTDRVLSRMLFYHGFALDGIEFVYDDDSRQLFGKRGGKPGGDQFDLGKWIDPSVILRRAAPQTWHWGVLVCVSCP